MAPTVTDRSVRDCPIGQFASLLPVVSQLVGYRMRVYPAKNSASTAIPTVSGTTTRPNPANLHQEISTPRERSRLPHRRVASDAHGVMSGPALTPTSSAAIRSGDPAVDSIAR